MATNGLLYMTSDYNQFGNGHTDEHIDSPVCSVLKRYFKEQQEFRSQVEEQRRGSQQHVAGDLIGGNDVVQEG